MWTTEGHSATPLSGAPGSWGMFKITKETYNQDITHQEFLMAHNAFSTHLKLTGETEKGFKDGYILTLDF